MTSVDKITKKQLEDRTPPQLKGKGFKKGQSGNPAGRPKGKRNIQTMFNLAIDKLVELGEIKGKGVLDIEVDIFKKVLDKARSGDIQALKLYLEYRYGKPIHQEGDTLNVNLQDETLSSEEAIQIKEALKHAGLSTIIKESKK